MQVKLVCTDLVALARSRPDRHSGRSHCQAFANVSSGSFLSVGGGSKLPFGAGHLIALKPSECPLWPGQYRK